MDTGTRVQNPDETVCISHTANTLGKDMNPAIGKIVGHTSHFNLDMVTSLGEGKF